MAGLGCLLVLPFVTGQPPEIINRVRATLGVPQDVPVPAVLEFAPPEPPRAALLFEATEPIETARPNPVPAPKEAERPVEKAAGLPDTPRLTQVIALPPPIARPKFISAIGLDAAPRSAPDAKIDVETIPLQPTATAPALKLAEHPVSWRKLGMILPPRRNGAMPEAVQFERPKTMESTPSAEALVAGDRVGILPAMRAPVPLPTVQPIDNQETPPEGAPAVRRPEARFGMPGERQP